MSSITYLARHHPIKRRMKWISYNNASTMFLLSAIGVGAIIFLFVKGLITCLN